MSTLEKAPVAAEPVNIVDNLSITQTSIIEELSEFTDLTIIDEDMLTLASDNTGPLKISIEDNGWKACPEKYEMFITRY